MLTPIDTRGSTVVDLHEHVHVRGHCGIRFELEIFFSHPPYPDSSVRTYDFPLLSVCEATTGKSVSPLEHERHFCKKCRTPIGPRRESDDIADYATVAKAVGKEVRTFVRDL